LFIAPDFILFLFTVTALRVLFSDKGQLENNSYFPPHTHWSDLFEGNRLNTRLFVFTLSSFHVISFHSSQGQCALLAISAQSGDTLPDNFIGFDSVPDKVADGSVVRVRYRCFRPCHLAVEVVMSTLRKTDLVVFRRKWISSAPRVYRIQQVLLRLPPSISHHPNFFSGNTQNVTVRAWLDYIKKGSEISTYHSSMLKIYKVLQVMPVSQRMSEPPTGCPSWSAQLIRRMTTDRIHQCPHETGWTLNHIEIFSKAFKGNMRMLFVNVVFCCVAYTQM